MSPSDWIAIAGIVCSLLGAAVLGIAAVQVPDFFLFPSVQAAQKDLIEMSRTAMERGWERYPADVREQALADAKETYEKQNEKLVRDTESVWLDDRALMVRRNVWGFLFICLGSILQGVAIVLHP